MSTPANPLRNPYFGELHVHTAWSLDAFVIASLNGPDEAFRYAKGEPARSSLNNAEENRISRPLDFAAVTEHAEWLGEYGLIVDPDYHPEDPEGRERVERYRASRVPGEDGRAGHIQRHGGGGHLRDGPSRPHPARPRGTGEGSAGGGPYDLAADRPDRGKPQRAWPVHHAERVRVDTDPGRGQPAPGHHLPRQRRPGTAAEQLRDRPPRTAVGLAGDRRRRPGQRAGDHAQRELQQRPDVQPPLQRRPGNRRGLRPPPGAVGTAGGDLPEQGRVGDQTPPCHRTMPSRTSRSSRPRCSSSSPARPPEPTPR